MRRLLIPLTLVATSTAMLVFLLPSGSAAANPTLQATVGPGFNITLKDANGVNVRHLDPGTYDIHVVDPGRCTTSIPRARREGSDLPRGHAT